MGALILIVGVYGSLCLLCVPSANGDNPVQEGPNPSDYTSITPNVTLQPANGIRIQAGTAVNLTVFVELKYQSKLNEEFIITLKINDDKTSKFYKTSGNVTFYLTSNQTNTVGSSFTVEMDGLRVGISALSVVISTESGLWEWTMSAKYPIRVWRPTPQVNTNLRLGVVGAMSLNFMTFGCKLKFDILKEYMKRPGGILVGFFCQYALMPLITYLLGRISGLQTNMAFALLTVGCAPGGGPSNLITVVLDGDLHMSIIMTFFSTVGALGMIPFWMYIVGSHVIHADYPASDINIPWPVLIIAVVWFSLPTAIGMLIARWFPRAAAVFVLIVRPIAFLALIAQVIVFLYLNYPILYYANTWQILFVSAATPYFAFIVSFLFALFVFQRTYKTAVTIMIETGIQNITFAFLLIIATLPQPDGDIACVVPLLVIFFTYGPLLFIVFPACAVWRRVTKPEEREYAIVENVANGQMSRKTSTSSMNKSQSRVSLSSIRYTTDESRSSVSSICDIPTPEITTGKPDFNLLYM